MSVAGNYVFVRMGTDPGGAFGEIRVYKRSDGSFKEAISLDDTNYYRSAGNQDIADVAESTQVRYDGTEYRIFTQSISQLQTHLIRWIPDE
jgi:hypothetical protein